MLQEAYTFPRAVSTPRIEESSSQEAFASSDAADSSGSDSEESEGDEGDKKSPKPNKSSKLSEGAIVGIVVGGVMLMIIALAVAFFVGTCHRRTRNAGDELKVHRRGGSYAEFYSVRTQLTALPLAPPLELSQYISASVPLSAYMSSSNYNLAVFQQLTFPGHRAC